MTTFTFNGKPATELQYQQKITDQQLFNAKIHNLAQVIHDYWHNINPYAKPYLNAMFELDKVTDHYYNEDGITIILYFLSNANSWRGEVAKRVKAELRRRCVVK